MAINEQDITKLKNQDIYSLMLFALYKLRGIPEYSALSELAFILDKNSILNLCEYFGGSTIKIPTIEELESLVYSLLLYEYVDIEHMDYNKAVKLIGYKSSELRKVKSDYLKLKKILEIYEFKNKN